MRTAGPFADAFQSKHVWPRQSVGMGAHALQKVTRNSNDREKSILQTNHIYQYGRVRTSAAHTDANDSAKHVRANRTANPAEVDGEGLGQVPA